MQITLEIVDPRGYKYRLTPEEARELYEALGEALGLNKPQNPITYPLPVTYPSVPSTFNPWAVSGTSIDVTNPPIGSSNTIRWGVQDGSYGTITLTASAPAGN